MTDNRISGRPEPRRRVSFVVSHLTPRLGLVAATLSLIDALSRDYDVRVFTIADEAATPPGHEKINVRSWGRRVRGWKRVSTVLRAYRHREELHDSVVVLSGAWAALPVLTVLPRTLRARTIVWEHSFDEQKIKSTPTLRILRAAARALYSRARAIVTVSESLRANMRSAGFGEPIKVIPNIVDKSRTTLGEAADRGRLLAVGSLTTTKNQQLTLRMLSLLPSHFSLDLLGDGPQRAALEHLAQQLRIDDRVRFHGYMSDPAPYFQKAEMLIHPSLGETYGIVLFEAAEFHRPVVAVNQSVMAAVIPSLVPGVTAEPRPEAFASAVLSLTDSPIAVEEYTEATQRRRAISQTVVRDWRRLIDEASS